MEIHGAAVIKGRERLSTRGQWRAWLLSGWEGWALEWPADCLSRTMRCACLTGPPPVPTRSFLGGRVNALRHGRLVLVPTPSFRWWRTILHPEQSGWGLTERWPRILRRGHLRLSVRRSPTTG